MKFAWSAILVSGALLTGGWVALPTTAFAADEALIAQSQPETRLRIAVLDFDFASTGGTGYVYSYFGSVGPARGVSELLTNKLVQNGTYSLIERSRIDAVLQEQNLAAAGRIDPSTAAQIGRILGADAVVIGSITRFNLQEEGGSGSFLGFGGSAGSRTAEVQLTARLVNTTTAEIIAAAEGSGTADQGGGGISTPFGSIGGDTQGDDQILSEAAEIAVSQLADQLAASSSAVAAQPATLPAIDAIVADVAGSTVIINKGSQDGFRTGMVLSIERVDREVLDPATGEVIRTITSPIGQIELTEVDARSGVGQIRSGSGFQVGDRARAVE